MDAQILKIVGQVAGIGGLAIGALLLIFREIIRKKIFPELGKSHAYKLLRLVLILTWTIAVLGILAWLYANQRDRLTVDEQIQQRQAALLAVPSDVLSQYQGFTTLPNAGFVRLLPRGRYDQQMTLRGGGAYFSFSRRTQEYGYGSDIELDSGILHCGFAGLDFGFFLSLGDVPLSELAGITAEPPEWLDPTRHEAWRYAWSYRPPATVVEARSEKHAFRNRAIAGATVSDSLAAVSNIAFLLRSINYNGSDVLVAAKIVNTLDDGSVVLGWRLLRAFDTPVASGPEPPQT